MNAEIGRLDDSKIYPLDAEEGGNIMNTNKRRGIAVFDLDGPIPKDFDLGVLRAKRNEEERQCFYRRGIRRFVIMYIKNTLGPRFFHSPTIKMAAATDNIWDFVNERFCMFPSYDSIPYGIKQNAIELFFETTSPRENLNDRIIQGREDFSNKDYDVVLVKEYSFYEGFFEEEDDFEALIRTDFKIIGKIYDIDWAGGRYFMRIRCLSADLLESEELAIVRNMEGWLSDGPFHESIF